MSSLASCAAGAAEHEWVDVTPLGVHAIEETCANCGVLRTRAREAFPLLQWSAESTLTGQTLTAQYACGCEIAYSVPPNRLLSNYGANAVPQECCECSGTPHPFTVRSLSRHMPMPGFYLIDPPTGAPRIIESVDPVKPEPKPPLELAFDTEPIVGWRTFRLVPFERRGGVSELRLVSLTGREAWEPRKRAEARCIPHSTTYTYGSSSAPKHEAPWPDCHCGIWATRERAACESQGAQASYAVVAEVYLWGRVLEFRHGWRAQYAYPKSLQFLWNTDEAEAARIAADLERLYGVRVELVHREAALSAEERTNQQIAAFTKAVAARSVGMNVAAQSLTEAIRKANEQLSRNLELIARHSLAKRTLPPPRPQPTIRDAFRKKRR